MVNKCNFVYYIMKIKVLIFIKDKKWFTPVEIRQNVNKSPVKKIINKFSSLLKKNQLTDTSRGLGTLNFGDFRGIKYDVIKKTKLCYKMYKIFMQFIGSRFYAVHGIKILCHSNDEFRFLPVNNVKKNSYNNEKCDVELLREKNATCDRSIIL